MALSNAQIQKLIKTPAHASQLQEAVNHENRVKLHTKAVDKADKALYFNSFLKWVKEGVQLPSDKYETFKGMCVFPIPTTSLCSSIFDSYQKIFETQDAFFDASMSQDSMKAEFLEYIKSLNLKEWFKTKGFETYKKQFNSVFIVDMPAEQLGARPLPYFYKVPISHVLDLDVDEDNKVEYIIFKGKDNQVICIDELRYSVWLKSGESYLLQSEAPHILGYCPAHIFATGNLYDEEDNNHIARKIPVSESVGDLDWLLFYGVAQRMYETYGPFPILATPDQQCDFTDAMGNSCQGGFVSTLKADGVTLSNYECPSCKKSSIVGPGSVFTRPMRTHVDQPDPGKLVEITPADVDSLDYITKKVDYLEWEIFANCTGSQEEQIIKQAINQDQVQSSHEGERAMLLRVKRDFEQAMIFIVDTMGRLMFGDYYEGCTLTMGDQFMLESKSEILQQFTDWKKSGLPNFLVSGKKDQLIQSEYKNNITEINRAELLNQLEPWPELSISECTALSLNLKFPEKFLLKIDFAKFVRKFERQNGDILFWGSLLSLDKKVDKLTEILIQFATDEERTAKKLEPAGSPQGPGK